MRTFVDIETVIARNEIQQLINRYAQAADAPDVDGLIACFTPNCHMELNSGEFVMDGHEAMRALMAGGGSNVVASAHLMCNSVIDVNGDRAHGETTAVSFVVVRDTGRMLIRGLSYSDEFVHTATGWLIARRAHRANFQSELPAGTPPSMTAIMGGQPER
jgi:hypothetical protein